MRKLCGVLMAMAVAACAANPNSDELSGESGNRSTAEGGRNPSTAVSTRPIEPGEVCPNGGVSIDVGIDENANGFLDEAEVDNTVSVCNGAAGPDGQDGGISELDIREVPAGDADCPNGGQLIVVGIDQNHDGELTDSEIESFHYICNGEDGIDGEDGEDASGGGSETGGNGGESGDDEESDDSEENGNNNGDGEFDEIENDNSGLGNVLYARTFNFDENFGGSAIITVYVRELGFTFFMQVTLDTVFVCEPGMGVIQGGALVELDRFFDENWVPVNFDGCANIPPSVNAGGHVYFEAIGFDSSEAFEFVFDDLEDEGIFLVSPS